MMVEVESIGLDPEKVMGAEIYRYQIGVRRQPSMPVYVEVESAMPAQSQPAAPMRPPEINTSGC